MAGPWEQYSSTKGPWEQYATKQEVVSASSTDQDKAYQKYVKQFSERYAQEIAMPIPGAKAPVVKSQKQWAEDNSARRADDLLGIPDAAGSILTGALAQLPASIYGVGKGIATGSSKAAEEGYNSAVEAMTWAPRTERGQKITEGAGMFMQAFGPNPYSPSMKPKMGKLPKANPVLSSLDAIDEAAAKPLTPETVPAIQVPELRMEHPIAAETRVREQNRRQPTADDYNNRDANARVVDEEIAAMADAEAAFKAEQEAAESARLNEFSMKAKQDVIDDTPHGDRPAQYGMTDTGGRIDENGIPIRADLSMEAQQLQNPLQRNLWGDELARKSEQEAPRSLTAALDKIPDTPFKGDARDVALSRLRGQAGAIDTRIFDPAYDTYKKLKEGLVLRFRGGPEPTVYAIDTTNKAEPKVISHAIFNRDRPYRPTAPDDNLQPRWVHTVPEHQKQGIAQEMYKFVAEQGNDIIPDTLQTSSGKKLWASLERNGTAQNSRVNAQRGRFNYKAIAEEASKLGKAVSTIGTKAINVLTPQERVVSSVINDNSFIPKGNAPETIIAAALKETDGPKLATLLQSGLTQTGAKTNSALMTGVARWINWGEKVGDKYFRENVKPVEQMMSNLPKDQMNTVMQVMIREMNNRKQYSIDQLSGAGLNDKQLTLYKQLRAEQDNVLRIQNEQRVALGMEPVSAQGAYFASMWNGNYHMPVYDKAGKLQWYVKTESIYEARKAAKWLQENHPELDAARMKPEYRPQASANNVPRDVIGMYESMLEVFKDTPMAETIKSLMDDSRQQDAFTARRHDVHFENKANVRGFLGDRPWLSEKENGLAAAKAQVQYLKDAYRWAPMQEAMANIKKVLSNEDLIVQQPNNMETTKLYTANAMGGTANVFKGFEAMVARGMGVSPGMFSKYIGDLKTLTYLQQLGLSTGYMIATPLQALVLGPSQHMKLSDAGFKHNPIKSSAMALTDTMSMLWKHQLAGYGKDVNSPMSPIGREALRYMEDNGIIDVSLFDEYAQLGSHKGVDTLKQTIGVTIQFPEKFARVMTFMSFVHHLTDSGVAKATLFRQAEEMTNATLTNFHKSARPLLVDKLGMAGELTYTYKSPMFNFYNSLFEFAQHGKRTGNYMPLVMAGVVMPGILGGMMNLPGAAELDGAVNLMKTAVSKWMPQHYDKVKNIGVKDTLMKNLPDVAVYGTVSAATGAQMASRFTNQVVDPENPLGDMLPVASQVGKLGSVPGAVFNPNETTLGQAMYDNTPPMVRGTAETMLPTFKSGDPRVGENGEKRQLYFNPSRLGEREGGVERTAKDELYRKLGLTSLSESRDKDAMFRNRSEDKRLKTVQDGLLTKINDTIIRKENPASLIEQFVLNGGEGAKLETSIAIGMQNANMTPQQRQDIRAKTLQQVESILRRKELEGK